jgi:hypothetical protein
MGGSGRIGLVEDGTSGHKDGCTCLSGNRSGGDIDPAVHLDGNTEAAAVDLIAGSPDLRHNRLDK